jgi:hypothetical protein
MTTLLSNVLASNNSLLLDSDSALAANNQSIFNFTYQPPLVEVYLNGIKLIKDTDFTAANGSAIILNEAAAANDIIEVVKFTKGRIGGRSNIITGNNIVGGGPLTGGSDVTISIPANLTSLTSVQSETLTNASGNLYISPATQKTEFRGNGSSTGGSIQLNCEMNTHGQTIKSQPHSQFVTNELTLPAGTDQEIVGTTAAQSLTNKTFANMLKEKVTVNNDAAASTVNLDAKDSSVLYYTGVSTGNWILNIRGDSSTSLDSVLGNGESLSVVFMATNGANTWVQANTHIDGSPRAMHWQSRLNPAGKANSIESYSVTVIKTAANTFTVLGSKSQYATTDLS